MRMIWTVLLTLAFALPSQAQVLPEVKSANDKKAAWEKAKKDHADATARMVQAEKDFKTADQAAQKKLKEYKDVYDASIKAMAAEQPKQETKAPAVEPAKPKDDPMPGYTDTKAIMDAMTKLALEQDKKLTQPAAFVLKEVAKKDHKEEGPKYIPSGATDPKRGSGLITKGDQGPTVATIAVKVATDDAKVLINGWPTKQTGKGIRVYNMHELKSGSFHLLEISVEYPKGPLTTQLRQIRVEAGMLTTIDMD